MASPFVTEHGMTLLFYHRRLAVRLKNEGF